MQGEPDVWVFKAGNSSPIAEIPLDGEVVSRGVVRRAKLFYLRDRVGKAVRLTEKFGGPEKSGGDRFEKMRSFVREELRRQVGRPPIRPAAASSMWASINCTCAVSCGIRFPPI